MGGSSQVDVVIRAGDIVTLISELVELSESGGVDVINGGAGLTGVEDVYFVLVDKDGTVVLDAETATIVTAGDGIVSYALDATDTATAGVYTYYWIVDNLAGTGVRRRTENLRLVIGKKADTFGDA